MNKRPLRKLAGLIVLYILIFFVIIVIQFKNETIINETFGPFHIILSETRNEDNIPTLKNTFQITAGDLTFYSDSLSTTKIIIGDNEQNLTLKSWQKKSSSDFILFFDNDVYVEFKAPEELPIPLTIEASLPEQAEKVIIPYKLTTSSEISVADEASIILTGAEALYKISAAQIDEAKVALSKETPYFSIAEYVEETQFTFDTVTGYELASDQAFNTTKNKIQKSLIDLFPANPGQATLSEKIATAWVAEMSLQGKYSQALETLSSYSANSARTYISTPFFNTLAKSNKTLTLSINSLNTDIKNSQNKNPLSIFSNENFKEKCVIIPRATLKSLLSSAKDTIEKQPDLISSNTATSILTIYNRLKKYGVKEADTLDSNIETLIKLIEACTSLDENDKLVIMNGSNTMSFEERINTGFALMNAGSIVGNAPAKAAGKLIINETIQSADQLTLETVAALYPTFVPENHFLPHIALLHDENDEIIWAWTIADDMTFKRDAENSIIIGASFNQNQIHHMIIKGIKKFSSIDIYGISYRTDPRFESYNSSGYVFENDTESLLLKYRQRSPVEEIKLYYKQ